MTKVSATREQIQSLANDGHYFRRKTVNSYTYITARKGRKEQSLGPFTEDNWQYIQNLTKIKEQSGQGEQHPPNQVPSTQEVDEWQIYQNEMNQLRKNILFDLSVYKATHCLHIGEGYCQYWRIINKPSYFTKLRKVLNKDLMVEVKESDDSKYWAFKAVVFTCGDCPTFLDKRMLNFIKERLDLNNKEKVTNPINT